LRVPGRALGRWAGEAGEEGSGGRWQEERVASGGVIFKYPGFTDAVPSGEEQTVPTQGGTTQRAIEQQGSSGCRNSNAKKYIIHR